MRFSIVSGISEPPVLTPVPAAVTMPFGAPVTRQIAPIGPPPIYIILPVVLAICVVSCLVAWRQIRAVQVVG